LTAVISISEETQAAVVQNFWCRLQMVLVAIGAHIENVFLWLTFPQDYWTQRHQIHWCLLCSWVIICN
jgi:hypothetical protein